MTPDITIGLPVRNGASGIGRTIETILAQTYGNFSALVSDNASSDETREICEGFASRDERIRVVRQASNLGALNNFRFVLERATTPLFMWMAHDDWLEPDALASCREALLARPDASGTVLETTIHEPDGSKRLARGAAPREEGTALRLALYLSRPADNSRFYGLFRTDVLRKSFSRDLPDVPAWDWLIMALTLVDGPHVPASRARLHRAGSSLGRYLSRTVSPLTRLLPTVPMSVELVRRLPSSLRFAVAPSLVFLAIHQAVRHQWARFSLRGDGVH